MDKIQELFHQKATAGFNADLNLRWEKDGKGNRYGWLKLPNPDDIEKIADIVRQMNGRVIAITAYFIRPEQDEKPKGNLELAYHFDLDGCTVTVAIALSPDSPQVNSITSILRSADWHERELQEFYQVKVINHPNAKPLFLDRGVDPVKKGLIPLSQAMDGDRSNMLWEKIFRADEGEGASYE